MDVHALTRSGPPRRLQVVYLRWSAIVGGAFVTLASYMLFALFGMAIGFSAPAPYGVVPWAAGTWMLIAFFLSGLLGGQVAGRLSGMARRVDGLLYGFVTWATFILLVLLFIGFVFDISTAAFGAGLGTSTGPEVHRIPAVDGGAPGGGGQSLFSVTSWWLFAALLLSLIGSLWGGIAGVKATVSRAANGQPGERHPD